MELVSYVFSPFFFQILIPFFSFVKSIFFQILIPFISSVRSIVFQSYSLFKFSLVQSVDFFQIKFQISEIRYKYLHIFNKFKDTFMIEKMILLRQKNNFTQIHITSHYYFILREVLSCHVLPVMSLLCFAMRLLGTRTKVKKSLD